MKTGATCQMENGYREGLCDKPATHVWYIKDGTEIAVCDQCLLPVLVNGCEVVSISKTLKDLTDRDLDYLNTRLSAYGCGLRFRDYHKATPSWMLSRQALDRAEFFANASIIEILETAKKLFEYDLS